MKWAFLIVGLAAVLPFSGWLRGNPREIPKVWVLIGVLPFLLAPYHLLIALDSWAGWPGYAQGAEISLLDLLALAMYLSLPAARHPLPFRLPMLLYFLAVTLASLQAQVPTAALFYPWQLARIFVLYGVVARACDDPRVVSSLLTGMSFGLCFEACYALWERFVLGELQVGGTLGHQNSLGLVSHFVVFPLFALLLAGERGWQPVVVPLAGLLTAVLTVSRATVGLAAVSYAVLFGLSMMRKRTPRKTRIALIAVLAIAALAPIAVSSFERRFSTSSAPADDFDERLALKNAAAMMLSDHPMGVGSNSFSLVANGGGYYDRAGVPFSSRGAQVHNIYWLVAAETGYIGILTFVLLLARPMMVAFACGWRNRTDPRGDLLLGLGVALLTVYIHSGYEWIFITYPAQYLYAISAGLVAGLARQLGYWGRAPVPQMSPMHLEARKSP